MCAARHQRAPAGAVRGARTGRARGPGGRRSDGAGSARTHLHFLMLLFLPKKRETLEARAARRGFTQRFIYGGDLASVVNVHIYLGDIFLLATDKIFISLCVRRRRRGRVLDRGRGRGGERSARSSSNNISGS